MTSRVRERSTLAILLTSGATFMAFLDTTAVNVAFPALRTSFPLESVSTLTWVVSAYAVLFAALLTPAGRLADVVGRRRVFLFSLAVFGVASAGCAAAPSLTMLIAARAVQGAAAAGMIPSALGVVLREVPPERRAETLGIWGGVASLAGAAGPSLGGVLIDATDWRTVFLINVPICAVLLVGSLLALPRRPVPSRALPDIVGTLSVLAGLGVFVLGLTKGSDWGWLTSRTLGCLIAGALLLGLALRRSRVHPAPAVEIDLWSSRMFAIANLASLLVGAAFFAWLLCGPLFLTTLWGYSILHAGFAVTPGAIASACTAIVVGKRVKAQHLRLVVAVGMLVFFGANLWLYAALEVHVRFLTLWLPANALAGAGAGAALTALATAGAVSLPPARLAAGIGMNTTARQVGGALGVAVMATILAAAGLSGALGFREVLLFTAVCALVAAITGLALRAPDEQIVTSAAPAEDDAVPPQALRGGRHRARPASAPAGLAAASVAVVAGGVGVLTRPFDHGTGPNDIPGRHRQGR